MLETVFYEILRMSLTGTFVILAVMICRFLLKEAPKVFSYALWGIVLFRLLCPVSIDTSFSFVPENLTSGKSIEYLVVDTLPAEDAELSAIDSELSMSENTVRNHVSTEMAGTSEGEISEQRAADIENTEYSMLQILVVFWVIGIVIFLAYSMVSLLRLKIRLIGSIVYDESKNIYLSDYIETPFVMGLVSPKIYLPSTLVQEDFEYVLLHEENHIRRKDYLWKLAAFVALVLHWFNPFAWLAFHLSSKDMEMSCDEAVMNRMDLDVRKDYCTSLLALSTGKRYITPVPLTFAEGVTKNRIQNVLKWRKPKRWVIIASVAVCVVAAIGCVTNRMKEGKSADDLLPMEEVTLTEAQIDDLMEQYVADAECSYDEFLPSKWIAAAKVFGAKRVVDSDVGYVYAYVLDSEFVLFKDMAYDQSGGHIPVKIKVKFEKDGIKYVSREQPLDGALYADSIKELFPKDIYDSYKRYDPYDENEHDKLVKKQEEITKKLWGVEISKEDMLMIEQDGSYELVWTTGGGPDEEFQVHTKEKGQLEQSQKIYQKKQR